MLSFLSLFSLYNINLWSSNLPCYIIYLVLFLFDLLCWIYFCCLRLWNVPCERLGLVLFVFDLLFTIFLLSSVVEPCLWDTWPCALCFGSSLCNIFVWSSVVESCLWDTSIGCAVSFRSSLCDIFVWSWVVETCMCYGFVIFLLIYLSHCSLFLPCNIYRTSYGTSIKLLCERFTIRQPCCLLVPQNKILIIISTGIYFSLTDNEIKR